MGTSWHWEETVVVFLRDLGPDRRGASKPFTAPSLGGVALTCLLLLCVPSDSSAQFPGDRSAFYEGFEGPEVSWHQAGADTPHRIEFHGRIRAEAHVGQGCERIRLVAGHGSYVYFAHPIGRVPVIDEVLVTVWVKSDRAGIQLLARVVFPRTRNPQTGEYLSTLISGTTYTQIGRWEQLRLEDLPREVARHARVLRSQYGPQVDEREAYISHVVLNIYGGPGVTNLWIDDLDVAGVKDSFQVGGPNPPAQPERPIPDPARMVGSVGGNPEGRGGGLDNWKSAPPQRPFAGLLEEPKPSEKKDPPPSPRIASGVFLVQGREFFPRVLQYQGESMAFLQRLGFNVIWVCRLPSRQLVHQAEQEGMWLICPPPIAPPCFLQQESPGAQERLSFESQEEISPEFDRVVAWEISLEAAGGDIECLATWARRIRQADTRLSRPLVCRTAVALPSLSRVADILWLTRPPIGSGLEMEEYLRWVYQQQLLVRPGTPLWVSIPTQQPASVRTQWTQVGGSRPPPEDLTPEQLRLAFYTAVAGGMQGLVYQSDRRLDFQESQTRAASLELVNREAEILEPWLAAGRGGGAVTTDRQEVQAALWQRERARLGLAFWAGAGCQYVVGQAAANQLHLLLAGVPEAHEAYQILPGRLRPLWRERVPGGLRIRLEEFDLAAAVVVSQDPSVLAATSRRAQMAQRRLAEVHHELAQAKLQQFHEVFRHLRLGQIALPTASEFLAKQLQEVEEQLAIGAQQLQKRQYLSGLLASQRAQRAVRRLERIIWEAAGGPEGPPKWPLAGCFSMLPEHLEVVRQVRVRLPGPNLLAGGDFEDLQSLLRSGWRMLQGNPEVAEGCAQLSLEAARSGRWGLHLKAYPRNPQSPPEIVPIPPVEVTTPAIPVQAGQCLYIHGWLQIPQPIVGSVDGLLIMDSVGGEALAYRFGRTSGWQRFEIYRIVPSSGRVQIRFVLTGLGEAYLDDIAVESIELRAEERGQDENGQSR